MKSLVQTPIWLNKWGPLFQYILSMASTQWKRVLATVTLLADKIPAVNKSKKTP